MHVSIAHGNYVSVLMCVSIVTTTDMLQTIIIWGDAILVSNMEIYYPMVYWNSPLFSMENFILYCSWHSGKVPLPLATFQWASYNYVTFLRSCVYLAFSFLGNNNYCSVPNLFIGELFLTEFLKLLHNCWHDSSDYWFCQIHFWPLECPIYNPTCVRVGMQLFISLNHLALCLVTSARNMGIVALSSFSSSALPMGKFCLFSITYLLNQTSTVVVNYSAAHI